MQFAPRYSSRYGVRNGRMTTWTTVVKVVILPIRGAVFEGNNTAQHPFGMWRQERVLVLTSVIYIVRRYHLLGSAIQPNRQYLQCDSWVLISGWTLYSVHIKRLHGCRHDGNKRRVKDRPSLTACPSRTKA